MANVHSIINKLAKKYHTFPLLAFLLPLAVRAIPEVLMGPYIVGFDTMAFYVSNTILWLQNGIEILGYLSFAPLFYTILLSVVSTGIPVITAIKIIAPLLMGILGLSIYYYARKGLAWSSIKSLAPALLGTVYFVSLRISWDMLRNELGLIFFFLILTLLTCLKDSSIKRYSLLSILMITVVLSHQLVSVLMFGFIAFTAITKLRHDHLQLIKLFVVSLPSLIFFLVVYFMAVVPVGIQEFTVSADSKLADWLGFSSFQSMLLSEAGFFLYCFLPLLPFVLLSLKKFSNFQLRTWLIITSILVLIPFAFVSPYRWLILLTYPLAFYTTEALFQLKTIKWRRIKIPLQKITLLYLILSTSALSIGYMIMSPEEPLVYFNPRYINHFEYQIPTSMLQNTISIGDLQSATEAIEWFKINKDEKALLLTHTAFYSWALVTLSQSQIKTYGFEEPDRIANLAFQEGVEEIYVIWWIPGQGWYAQSTISSSFLEVYRAGDIAIYKYIALQ